MYAVAVLHLLTHVFIYCFLCPVMAEQKKFSLVKAVAGNKRTESSQQSAAAKKIPKVSEMTPVEARPQKIVTNAPVVVCVYPVTMCGKYTWSLQEQTKLAKCVVIVYSPFT